MRRRQRELLSTHHGCFDLDGKEALITWLKLVNTLLQLTYFIYCIEKEFQSDISGSFWECFQGVSWRFKDSFKEYLGGLEVLERIMRVSSNYNGFQRNFVKFSYENPRIVHKST